MKPGLILTFRAGINTSLPPLFYSSPHAGIINFNHSLSRTGPGAGVGHITDINPQPSTNPGTTTLTLTPSSLPPNPRTGAGLASLSCQAWNNRELEERTLCAERPMVLRRRAFCAERPMVLRERGPLCAERPMVLREEEPTLRREAHGP